MIKEIIANLGMQTTEDLTIESGNFNKIANQDTRKNIQKINQNQIKKTLITLSKTIKNNHWPKMQMNMANLKLEKSQLTKVRISSAIFRIINHLQISINHTKEGQDLGLTHPGVLGKNLIG